MLDNVSFPTHVSAICPLGNKGLGLQREDSIPLHGTPVGH